MEEFYKPALKNIGSFLNNLNREKINLNDLKIQNFIFFSIDLINRSKY